MVNEDGESKMAKSPGPMEVMMANTHSRVSLPAFCVVSFCPLGILKGDPCRQLLDTNGLLRQNLERFTIMLVFFSRVLRTRIGETVKLSADVHKV